jgi:tRNA-Thr(GGU) m(6)t(6)A37 methyltransferase TsaA
MSDEHVCSVRPIGVIHTPFRAGPGTPIQPVFATGTEGVVTVHGEFALALTDIEGFDRLWLIYWLDRAGPYEPVVTPYRDTVGRGLFATRAPCRPNPIGLSVVRLLERRGATLRVADIDVLDGTPLIDIKPYVPRFDAYPQARAGWFDASGTDRAVADDRFHRS